jgi:general secretion pathway protein J
LIEMLAGLTIAVAILAVVAQFTSQSLRNWNRGESTIAVMEMLTSGLGRLRTDLALALPMRPPGTDSPSVMFIGQPQQLLFVATTGFGAADRGLEMISVNVVSEEDGVAVVRQRGPVTSGPAPLRDPVVLLRGRMQVRFTYRDDAGQALESWTNRDRLPKAVEINIVNPAGVSVFPAPVVMKLPANLSAACVAGGGGDEGVGSGGCPTGRPRRTPNQQNEQDGQNLPNQPGG